ncbi:MAG TPA: PD-(D/E)XK nuclease family protein [Candidatus Saccharimonadales bacterium]|nr:PD-(D/E)XK nuclease family protein [Candidatus Saccharimonadales bacterium]
MAYKRFGGNAPYQPGQKGVFKLSRSKIDLFMQCPRCFWLDARLKIKRPDGPPFQINKAIDQLLKKEFDTYRQKGEPHPWMTDNQVNAIPMQHEQLDKWRQNFIGVSTIHKPTNLHIFGAIDDLWADDTGRVYVVDYKATAKAAEVSLDAGWQITYKRQMEVYQWLLRQNGLDVSDTGYFVYTNGRLDLDGFYDKVEFRTKIISYKGDASWVEPTLLRIKACMEGEMPEIGTAAMGGECEYCAYARARTQLTMDHMDKTKLKKEARPKKGILITSKQETLLD